MLIVLEFLKNEIEFVINFVTDFHFYKEVGLLKKSLSIL